MTTLVIMRFRIAPEREREWESFVAERGHDMAKEAGYVRMYLLRPESQSNEYRVVSWWEDLADPQSWIRKETYAFSESRGHQGIVTGPVGHEVLQIVGEF